MNNPPFSLDANERILETIHRHWIDLVTPVISGGLLFIAGLALVYLQGRYADKLPLPNGLLWLLAFVIIVLGALILLVGYYVYRRNVLILTNLHLVQVEQNGLFNRRVSQLSLIKVQDVTGVRPGFLATMLDYGDVEVQSAGEQEKFTFHNAPAPEALADKCLETHELCMRERAAAGIPDANPE